MRKLAIFAFAFTGAIFLSHYILPWKLILPLGIVFMLLFVLVFFLKAAGRTFFLLLFMALSLGFFRYFLFFQNTLSLVSEFKDRELKLSYTALDNPETTANGIIRLKAAIYKDGKRLDAYIYDSQRLMADVRPGDTLEANLKIRSAMERYSKPNYSGLSKGILLRAELLDEPELTGSETSLKSLLLRAKLSFLRRMELVYDRETNIFLKALIMGDTSELQSDYKFDTALKITGLRHMVAVSGLHIVIVYGFFVLFSKKMWWRICSLCFVWLFAIMSGMSPSVIRASAMLTYFTFARFFGRDADFITSMAIPLMGSVLFNPAAIGSLSLQLSFLSVGGISLFFFIFELEKLKNKFIKIAASSAGALIFTSPLSLFYFGSFSLISPIANIFVLPILSLLFISGALLVIISFFLPSLAGNLAVLPALLVKYIRLTSGFFASFKYSALYSQNLILPYWLALLFICLLAFYFLKKRLERKKLIRTMLSLLTLTLLITIYIPKYKSSKTASINALDVGQGLSVAALSGNSTLIFDCGSINSMKNAGDYTAEFLLTQGRDEVDALVLSHLHRDHANGVTRLISRIKVKKIYISEISPDSDGILAEIKKEAELCGSELIFLSNGDYSLRFPELSLMMYSGFGRGSGNENDLGIISELDLRGYRALITGDVSYKLEEKLSELYNLSDISLLIVGHHGSDASSSPLFLDAICPETAIISVGYNSFGHPSESVIERLKAHTEEIFRTDRDGNIRVWVE